MRRENFAKKGPIGCHGTFAFDAANTSINAALGREKRLSECADVGSVGQPYSPDDSGECALELCCTASSRFLAELPSWRKRKH